MFFISKIVRDKGILYNFLIQWELKPFYYDSETFRIFRISGAILKFDVNRKK